MRATLLICALTAMSLLMAAPAAALEPPSVLSPDAQMGTCPSCTCPSLDKADDGVVAYVMACLRIAA